MSVLRFTIPGAARGKGRPRFGRTRSGAPVTFTDAKTAAYENLVALAAVDAGAQPVEGPVSVSVTIRMAPPPSTSAKDRAAMLLGKLLPAKRPDLDNVAKAVLDGLNGVAFHDDAQIITLLATKLYAESAGVDVQVICIGGPA